MLGRRGLPPVFSTRVCVGGGEQARQRALLSCSLAAQSAPHAPAAEGMLPSESGTTRPPMPHPIPPLGVYVRWMNLGGSWEASATPRYSPMPSFSHSAFSSTCGDGCGRQGRSVWQQQAGAALMQTLAARLPRHRIHAQMGVDGDGEGRPTEAMLWLVPAAAPADVWRHAALAFDTESNAGASAIPGTAARPAVIHGTHTGCPHLELHHIRGLGSNLGCRLCQVPAQGTGGRGGS